MFDHLTFMLAQEDAPPTPLQAPAPEGQVPVVGQPPNGDPSQKAPPAGGGSQQIFFIIFAALIFMIIFSTRGQKKEKKKRAAMLDALKKGDRVQTIGGILGAVVEIREEHVVVKIDENTNTRIKVGRSAIQSVIADE